MLHTNSCPVTSPHSFLPFVPFPPPSEHHHSLLPQPCPSAITTRAHFCFGFSFVEPCFPLDTRASSGGPLRRPLPCCLPTGEAQPSARNPPLPPPRNTVRDILVLKVKVEGKRRKFTHQAQKSCLTSLILQTWTKEGAGDSETCPCPKNQGAVGCTGAGVCAPCWERTRGGRPCLVG